MQNEESEPAGVTRRRTECTPRGELHSLCAIDQAVLQEIHGIHIYRNCNIILFVCQNQSFHRFGK